MQNLGLGEGGRWDKMKSFKIFGEGGNGMRVLAVKQFISISQRSRTPECSPECHSVGQAKQVSWPLSYLWE